MTIFHLAFPVDDLEKASRFYVDGLGCTLGRRNDHAMILNLAGHQVVAQRVKELDEPQKGIYPRHFGLVLESEEEWKSWLDRAQAADLEFYMEAKRRHPGTPTEHDTFFLKDPAGNLLEFKYYHRESAVFGERGEKQTGDY